MNNPLLHLYNSAAICKVTKYLLVIEHHKNIIIVVTVRMVMLRVLDDK
jgi:hypothetical protein